MRPSDTPVTVHVHNGDSSNGIADWPNRIADPADRSDDASDRNEVVRLLEEVIADAQAHVTPTMPRTSRKKAAPVVEDMYACEDRLEVLALAGGLLVEADAFEHDVADYGVEEWAELNHQIAINEDVWT